MICPAKHCRKEIPDDSCFCDYCGVQLFRCDVCGFVGTGRFCGKCGGPMSAIQAFAVQESPIQQSAIQLLSEIPAVPASPAAATVRISFSAEKIFLCHPEGWNIEISDGDILGRTNGPHAAWLGKFDVISSTHAKVTKENNEWFITDLKSTNRTYINGTKLEPDIPVKIKQDDVIILADVTFTVREK